MRIKAFRLSIIITIVSLVFIPLFIISIYFINSIKHNIRDNNYKYLAKIRDEKIILIQEYLYNQANTIEKLVSNYANIDISAEKKVKMIMDSSPNITGVINYNFNFKPISILGKDGFKNENDIPDVIRITLQGNFYFSNYYFRDLSLPDGKSILVLFLKDPLLDEYYSISINYSFFDIFLTEYKKESIDIYNSKYQKVSSSIKDYDSRRVNTNPVTDKMVKGFVDNIEYKGIFNSFGFIELKGTDLFIVVHNSVDKVYKSIKTYIVNSFFFYFLFSLIALVTAIFLTKYFYSIKESEIRKEIFSNRFSFFYRIKNTLKYIDERYIEVAKLYKGVNYLKNDIEVILNDLPEVKIDDKEQNK